MSGASSYKEDFRTTHSVYYDVGIAVVVVVVVVADNDANAIKNVGVVVIVVIKSITIMYSMQSE